MADNQPITLKVENIPAMQEKHQDKIDRAIGYDSDTQQKRLKLFDRDPGAIAAHYPELQAKSQELRKQSLAIQSIAANIGWLAATAAAAATSYAVYKKKFGSNKLIQGIMITFSAITAGFAGNFAANSFLGSRVRAESKDLAEASRIALEREYAPNMEDTAQKIAARLTGAQPPATQNMPEEIAADALAKAKASAASAPKMADGHAAALDAARQQEAAQQTGRV